VTKEVCGNSQNSLKSRQKVPRRPTSSGDILKCANDIHFTIPWGHGRGFINGSAATQLALVGHMIMTPWWMYCSTSRLHLYYTHSYKNETYFFSSHEVYLYFFKISMYSREFVISDTAMITSWGVKVGSQTIKQN